MTCKLTYSTCQPPWWLQNTVCRYRSSLFRVQCVKQEGALGPKTGVKLNTAILSKLGGRLFFSRLFSVCSRNSRSNNWRIGNCFVFVFINFIVEKTALLVISRLLLLPKLLYILFLNNKTKNETKVDWPLTLTFNLSSGDVCFAYPQFTQ